MYRFEYRGMYSYRSRRKHSQRTGDDRGFIGENIAKHVFGYDDVETARELDELHGGVIDKHILGRNVGIFFGDFLRYFAP